MKRATERYHSEKVIAVISIHALVKRATVTRLVVNSDFDISIHALVKRATNPVVEVTSHNTISIHALVKRATLS